jgi:hypothetical protein
MSGCVATWQSPAPSFFLVLHDFLPFDSIFIPLPGLRGSDRRSDFHHVPDENCPVNRGSACYFAAMMRGKKVRARAKNSRTFRYASYLLESS